MTTEERLNKLEAEVSALRAEVSALRVHVNEVYRLLGFGPPDPPRPAVQTTEQAAHDRRVQEQEAEKWRAVYEKRDPWSLARQDHIEESQAKREAQQGHPTLERQREVVDQKLEQFERTRQQQR